MLADFCVPEEDVLHHPLSSRCRLQNPVEFCSVFFVDTPEPREYYYMP
jgi:hypothetical protein